MNSWRCFTCSTSCSIAYTAIFCVYNSIVFVLFSYRIEQVEVMPYPQHGCQHVCGALVCILNSHIPALYIFQVNYKYRNILFPLQNISISEHRGISDL